MTSIEAGFPSPADDYIEGSLDLNQHLVKHPAATFFVRVSGQSLDNTKFCEEYYVGDLLPSGNIS
jgi:DNA polymerase V